MKKIFLLFAALVIVFANVLVACPPGYDGPEQSTVTYEGCTIGFEYCYMIDGFGLHHITITGIFVYPPCDESVYEEKKGIINDQILASIALGEIVVGEWGLPIPLCPNGTLCLLKINDAFCYNGWYKDYDIEELKPPPPEEYPYVLRMQVCDDGEVRSCHSTIYFCWEIKDNQQILHIEKYGYQEGHECPENCEWNCVE